uniref:Uncharacterized protein n=1 Tax=Marseillevirus LCMAC202 TaxID=2506606 RepID=A0A481YY28_9VIRU|nr:MAG: protein of unknown function DUF4419 [Marseillevirus LCMAC202]
MIFNFIFLNKNKMVIEIPISDSLSASDTQMIKNSKNTVFGSKDSSKITIKGKLVKHTIPDKDDETLYFMNYLSYVKNCWNGHFGVDIDPTVIHYTILSEINEIVRKDSNTYRHIFTNSNEKQTIELIDPDIEDLINLEMLAKALNEIMPISTRNFLTKYSTTTDEAFFAQMAALADIVSPYYDYQATYCGIPRIRVLGTRKDWEKLQEIFLKNIEVFRGTCLEFYLQNVNQVLGELIQNTFDTLNLEFWKDMFDIPECGSGHDDQITGWLTRFYTNSQGFTRHTGVYGLRLVDRYGNSIGDSDQTKVWLGRAIGKYPAHVSIVDYKVNRQNGCESEDYRLVVGLFFGKLDGNYPYKSIVPHFGHLLFKNETSEKKKIMSSEKFHDQSDRDSWYS